MIRSSHAAFVAALLVLPVLLAGCDALDAQAEFEEEAFLPPAGIARTDADGNVIADDPDDWRTAPLYAFSGFRVYRRAHPNPAALNEVVTIQVQTDDAIPGGLHIVAYRGDVRREIPGQRLDIPGAGFYPFTFTPSLITGAQPGDLWRLVFFDGESHVVTYGDLQIE